MSVRCLSVTIAFVLVVGFLIAQQEGQAPSPAESKTQPSTDLVSALEKRISELEKQVKELNERVKALEDKVFPKQKSDKAQGYVGNSRTLKFHRLECEWAKRISLNSRAEFKTREEAIQQGYQPCLYCQP